MARLLRRKYPRDVGSEGLPNGNAGKMQGVCSEDVGMSFYIWILVCCTTQF